MRCRACTEISLDFMCEMEGTELLYAMILPSLRFSGGHGGDEELLRHYCEETRDLW